MTLTVRTSVTLAERQASQNLARNLEALRRSQPQLVGWVSDQMLDVEWMFARDRYLTALDAEGLWMSGCSLPLRAAEAMLRRMEIRGAVGCFLAPAHAAQIRASLARLRSEQAIVAIVPELTDLAFMLNCDDFASDIAANRLWFAYGPAWEVTLRDLFDQRSGLATPSQFIRTQELDNDSAEPLIATAQRVFAEVGVARAARVETLKQAPVSEIDSSRICLVAPSKFRLWNDFGHALRGAVGSLPAADFDTDDPQNSSPLALLEAARSCGAVFTLNTSRTDWPGLLPESLPWITWATAGRVPSAVLAGPDDHLIVADTRLRDVATRSGWHASRVHIGAIPKREPRSAARTGPLVVIADTCLLDTPRDLADYSSHSLAWEAIRHELLRNPFVLTDVQQYVAERLAKLSVSENTFPTARFVEKLIVPAYQQGLIRVLAHFKVPIKLWGAGWSEIPEFKSLSAGALQDRETFGQIVDAAPGLVHVWPGESAHPIDALGKPLVKRWTRAKPEQFVKDARSAALGKLPAAACPSPALSAALLEKIMSSLCH